MTDELTKTFFDTFGIEPNCQNKFINPSKCPFIESRECCDCVSFEYPQISDRILLELICILRNSYYVSGENIEVLKERVLRGCIKFRYDHVTDNETVKQQVQALFEEG